MFRNLRGPELYDEIAELRAQVAALQQQMSCMYFSLSSDGQTCMGVPRDAEKNLVGLSVHGRTIQLMSDAPPAE